MDSVHSADLLSSNQHAEADNQCWLVNHHDYVVISAVTLHKGRSLDTEEVPHFTGTQNIPQDSSQEEAHSVEAVGVPLLQGRSLPLMRHEHRGGLQATSSTAAGALPPEAGTEETAGGQAEALCSVSRFKSFSENATGFLLPATGTDGRDHLVAPVPSQDIAGSREYVSF